MKTGTILYFKSKGGDASTLKQACVRRYGVSLQAAELAIDQIAEQRPHTVTSRDLNTLVFKKCILVNTHTNTKEEKVSVKPFDTERFKWLDSIYQPGRKKKYIVLLVIFWLSTLSWLILMDPTTLH